MTKSLFPAARRSCTGTSNLGHQFPSSLGESGLHNKLTILPQNELKISSPLYRKTLLRISWYFEHPVEAVFSYLALGFFMPVGGVVVMVVVMTLDASCQSCIHHLQKIDLSMRAAARDRGRCLVRSSNWRFRYKKGVPRPDGTKQR